MARQHARRSSARQEPLRRHRAARIDTQQRRLIGTRRHIFAGSSLGCTEGPHLYRRGDFYFPAERPVRFRPDWLCEGLSPRTAVRDQGVKRALNQRSGIPWYWLVDPSNRTLSVLRLGPEGYVVDHVAGDTGLAALPPFDAVEIDLSAIFPPVD